MSEASIPSTPEDVPSVEVLELIAARAVGLVVEIAFGRQGWAMSYMYGPRAHPVIGVELVPDARVAAEARTGPRARLRVVAGRAEQLPFRDRSVDAVVSICALCTVSCAAALEEIARVLAPGGRYVFLEHVPGAHPPPPEPGCDPASDPRSAIRARFPVVEFRALTLLKVDGSRLSAVFGTATKDITWTAARE